MMIHLTLQKELMLAEGGNLRLTSFGTVNKLIEKYVNSLIFLITNTVINPLVRMYSFQTLPLAVDAMLHFIQFRCLQ